MSYFETCFRTFERQYIFPRYMSLFSGPLNYFSHFQPVQSGVWVETEDDRGKPQTGHGCLRPKKIYVFQVSRPYLGFCPDPKHFIVNCEQNVVKFAEKWGEMY